MQVQSALLPNGRNGRVRKRIETALTAAVPINPVGFSHLAFNERIVGISSIEWARIPAAAPIPSVRYLSADSCPGAIVPGVQPHIAQSEQEPPDKDATLAKVTPLDLKGCRQKPFDGPSEHLRKGLDITLTALNRPITFGDSKEGMFAIRVASPLQEEGGTAPTARKTHQRAGAREFRG